ncbi:MAG: bifunctional (p)ppGpp synthetase/guanosine-3',5'-bis(diphosphate) 3'-pyrophosphohydrolase [Betaproteobacteria bacterium]
MTAEVRQAVVETDPATWLLDVGRRFNDDERGLLVRAMDLASARYAGVSSIHGDPLLSHCTEIARILNALRLDVGSIVGALLSGLPLCGRGWQDELQRDFGPPILALVEGFARMEQIQALRSSRDESKKAADHTAQLESVRKMLLAMVQDVRVVLIKLADQTQTLRYIAGRGDQTSRAAAARDTFELHAPLANRLGVWQLKWELEDLAFRCSDPDTYKRIARELDEKRGAREAFITDITAKLREELRNAHIDGEVSGRSKHIYSIYRKLSRKDMTLSELFDVRAVRVLVNDVKDCYAVLGLIHNLWTPLAKEFDDYIAKPKPNDYRSLHTAVVGPDQKVLEVQIRTFEMHQHSEYGVAAHWRYKEGPQSGARPNIADDDKIAWLRQILEWKDGLANVVDLAEHFRTGLFEEHVYVLTPQGRVIDLPKGATPVDFAYHVHTELGHRCRSARVDGVMVPLHYALSNGQTVEITAAKTGGPSRDWLNPELGFLHSGRGRAKVRQWFNNQNLEISIAQGRAIAEKGLQRAGMTALGLDALAERMGFDKLDEFLAQTGRGEITAGQIQTALRSEAPVDAPASVSPIPLPVARDGGTSQGSGDILVVGVDKLLTVLAKCCKPAPPDPIIGFVTRGRGVTVHRQQCANVPRLAAERMIVAEWGSDAGSGRFSVDLQVDASSDPDLMREVLDLFSREKVRVLKASSHSKDLQARLAYTVEVGGLDQLRRLLTVIGELPGVVSASRR